MRRGIDVSTFQKKIDWKKVKESGASFAIIKAGQGRSEVDPNVSMFEDSTFKRNIEEAAGFGIDCGVYYYMTATTIAEAEREARHFVSIIEPYRDLISLYAVADVESKYLPNDKALLTDIVHAFCREVRKHGFDDAVYTNPNFLKFRLNDISDLDLWLALWRDVNNAPSVKDYPNLKLWQYGTGKIDGVSGDCDCNIEIVPKARENNTDNAHDWGKDAVSWAIKNGLVLGNADGDLMLDKHLTREEAFVLMHRLYKFMGRG